MTAPPPLSRAHAVRELDVDGAVTLFHEPTQTALVLNETASDVWRLLDGRRTVADIVDELAQVYAADAGTIRSGVHAALRQLADHHVLDGAPHA
ncbi:PqqD family protein [Jiangella alba]|uniref:Coenzyme PQQ synthesis protein D (PqqD) n=1 Tax=Jiangella alba TaxID=561176 RepID=A0A1H5PU25_9ACTN|nr:PqqD family protein [Jiangella alba]SEF17199.1 Coenzyme PQQ synthesis protein D (PqqD) [Jiangella alba]